MAQQLTEMLHQWGLSPEMVIFIISLLPVIELRGGLIAAALLGVKWYVALPICVAGNMLPIPFVLLFLRRVFKWLRKIRWLQKPIDALEARARKRGKRIQTGTLIGLILFVGIPLPGTGAWTGALAADLFDIRLSHSLPAIGLGVLLAGAIMLVLSYFVPGLFGF